ncbi:MAG: IS4 family transposase [Anaerolineaceae bacterium]|nr:IS4 family transposase [Anaerolineaceae bacterium]
MIDKEREATYQRLQSQGEELVLAVQDTTTFNFSRHEHTQGLGVLEDNKTLGFFAHTSLAVSTNGVPIGLLDQQVWSRPYNPHSRRKVNGHQALPITEKESMKWIQGLRNSVGSQQTWRTVTICDREADIYELFQEADNLGAGFIIRAVRDRKLESDLGLKASLLQLPCERQFTFNLERHDEQAARQATVELRYTTLTLQPPQNRNVLNTAFPLTPLVVHVIEVLEKTPPEGVTALHWVLLTNLLTANVEDAQRWVRFYSYRWLVERFHFVLKTGGCHFEDSQLRTFEALTRFLALCSTVAWRILWMTYQARQTPDTPCTVVLTDPEWQALSAYMTNSPNPFAEPPSLRQAIRWIGQLGGFIGRKHDGEPGVKVLWRGWLSFQSIFSAWLIFHPLPDVGNV